MLKYIIIITAIILFGCESKVKKTWKFEKVISLGDATPVGLVVDDSGIYYSDVKGNRVVRLDTVGNELDIFEGFERPMHIFKRNNVIYVPEFGKSQVTTFNVTTFERQEAEFSKGVETPAAIFIEGQNIAIVDFMKHNIVLKNTKGEKLISEKGHESNQLYYPTDVSINRDTIYIADAYNHRIQLFDLKGNHIKSLANNDSINTLSGMIVTTNFIAAGDYENNKVIVYNKQGIKQQVLTTTFNKPIEIAIYKNKMYIANFEGNSLSVYKLE